MPAKPKPICSFCGKTKKQVGRLMAGPKIQNSVAHICESCIETGYMFVCSSEEEKTPNITSTILTPREIKSHLDDYVVGQDNAKTILGVALYNHYKRINTPVVDGVRLEKSNIILMGPSGCGKTLIATTIANLMDLPIVIVDSTSLTESGYVGDDVDSMFVKLYNAAGKDVQRTQRGIIFIDEIDKKCNRQLSDTNRDVSGEGVQQALLRLVEGDTIYIDDPHSSSDVCIETKDILFIIGGSFVGLEKIVNDRVNKGSSIGIGASINKESYDVSILSEVCPSDLHKFGFIREFIDRFPITAVFHSLDEDMLVKVLTEPKNSIISQFKGLFKIEGVSLEFEDKYIRTIARQSIERKTGARGLRAILEKSLVQLQFDLPTLSGNGFKRIVVDENGTQKYYKRK